MSTTPGWYPLPKEEGMMDYWDGTAWAGKKRPIPAAAPAPDAQPITQAPAPLEEPISGGGLPGLLNTTSNNSSPWAPDKLIDQVKVLASDKKNQATGMQAGGGALIADGIVGFGEKRSGIFGAISMVMIGIVVLIGSLMFMNSLKMQSHESSVQGTVTEVTFSESRNSDGKRTTTCSPIATFNVEGTDYTASPSGSVSPCPWSEGEKVDIYYDKTNPGDARVSSEKETKFIIIFPFVGVFLILAGIGTFIVRALSIGAGIWLWRKGKKNKEALNG